MPSWSDDFKLAGPMGSKDEIQKILSKHRAELMRVPKHEVQKLRRGEILSIDLTDRDEQVVIKALKFHPEAHQKIGCGISKVVVGRRITQDDDDLCCFFVIRKDGSKVDFSYNKIFGKRSSGYSLESDRFTNRAGQKGHGSCKLTARSDSKTSSDVKRPSTGPANSGDTEAHRGNQLFDSWKDAFDHPQAENNSQLPDSWDLDA